MDTLARSRPWRSLPWLAAFVLLCAAPFAGAQQQAAEADPPGRVGHLSYRQGSVVFAPEGDEEWTELPQNRPLTTGDRVWSDRGARAEVHLGSATLHVDGESHVGVSALDDRTAQFILMQGTVNARVRELAGGENFEIDTPHLAMRATQPGSYRVEVDPAGGSTRVVVHSGMAAVFGEGGQTVSLGAGQQASFAGRGLQQVQAPPWRQDDFTQWAADRNRAEDQSISARYVPRGVVGYQQLDAHGTWGQDPSHGAVWYPTTVAQDWAPYRDGRWTWVDPWGWTWVDDAPWGFAPFHYGRWATINNRWGWVPGPMATRPVYSPGLVVFMGGNGVDLGIGGPSVGWYPLAPGEAWWPTYRASPRYMGFVNFNINLGRYPRSYDNHFHRRHFHGVTVVREDDFRRGRNVHE
ncbi:MAG: chromosome partitioning protein ParA, partial [Comamonadaceae bacterium]